MLNPDQEKFLNSLFGTVESILRKGLYDFHQINDLPGLTGFVDIRCNVSSKPISSIIDAGEELTLEIRTQGMFSSDGKSIYRTPRDN
jgi:hypothetical protein